MAGGGQEKRGTEMKCLFEYKKFLAIILIMNSILEHRCRMINDNYSLDETTSLETNDSNHTDFNGEESFDDDGPVLNV